MDSVWWPSAVATTGVPVDPTVEVLTSIVWVTHAVLPLWTAAPPVAR